MRPWGSPTFDARSCSRRARRLVAGGGTAGSGAAVTGIIQSQVGGEGGTVTSIVRRSRSRDGAGVRVAHGWTTLLDTWRCRRAGHAALVSDERGGEGLRLGTGPRTRPTPRPAALTAGSTGGRGRRGTTPWARSIGSGRALPIWCRPGAAAGRRGAQDARCAAGSARRAAPRGAANSQLVPRKGAWKQTALHRSRRHEKVVLCPVI
jgi:hypothetical protein